MNVMARRLTIISLMLAIFAILLTAAVEADAKRRGHHQTGMLTACAAQGNAFCRITL